MVRIRLQRRGRRKRPIHHIVVADSREPRDGRIIEDLGRFNNLAAVNEVDVDEERAIYWLKQGAQPSDTVRSIFRHQGILYKMHLIRWDKSEEEIEEALTEWRENREKKGEKSSSAKQKQKAMLEAEEKEYQKQLKKKAEEAAKERAKQEAIEEAEAKKAEEERQKAEKEHAEAVENEQADDKQEPRKEAEEAVGAKTTQGKTEPTAEEEPSETQQEQQQAPNTEEEKEEAAAEETVEEPEAAEEPKEEASASEETEEETSEKSSPLSTDMLAKEAINHIEETPLDELSGFVPDEEDRVTVKRALKDKQEEE
jgi:ribosomal protein S16